MIYLSVLGRQPEISIAELQALFSNVKKIAPNLATFSLLPPQNDHYNSISSSAISSLSESNFISRLGGTIKLAQKLEVEPIKYLQNIPAGKITIGVSDYSKNASVRTAKNEALKFKKILVRHGRSVRVVENKTAALSTATSLHNGLSGKNEHKLELIKHDDDWYRVIGVQDIDSYSRRDQARPARDAKVGMLPPKLAQILINLCGPLPAGSRILDPFCGTGVILQEALLMGYQACGTDLNPRMIEYTEKNLNWLLETQKQHFRRRNSQLGVNSNKPSNDERRQEHEQKCRFSTNTGDATSFQWTPPIDGIACEAYLGKPMSTIPSEIKLKAEKQYCKTIILGFLKNLSNQIEKDTPVVIAVPAWLRNDGTYSRLDLFASPEEPHPEATPGGLLLSEKKVDHPRSLSEEKPSFSSEATPGGPLLSEKKVDEITKLGYNVDNKTRDGLLYHRDNQVVARDIIILRKK